MWICDLWIEASPSDGQTMPRYTVRNWTRDLAGEVRFGNRTRACTEPQMPAPDARTVWPKDGDRDRDREFQTSFQTASCSMTSTKARAEKPSG